jgi:hypothetical protein
MEHSKIDSRVKLKITIEAKADKVQCGRRCFDFGLYFNRFTNGYFVRYTRVEMVEGSASPAYRWICFDTEGVRTDCDPIIADLEQHNHFYSGMVLIENFIF